MKERLAQPLDPARVARQLLVGEVDGRVGLQQHPLAGGAPLDPRVDLGPDPRAGAAEPRERAHDAPVEALRARGVVHEAARRERPRRAELGRCSVGRLAVAQVRGEGQTVGGQGLVGVAVLRRQRIHERGLDRLLERRASPPLGEHLVGVVGPGGSGPVADERGAQARHRVLRLRLLGPRSTFARPLLLTPGHQLVQEQARPLRADVVEVPEGAAHVERASRRG